MATAGSQRFQQIVDIRRHDHGERNLPIVRRIRRIQRFRALIEAHFAAHIATQVGFERLHHSGSALKRRCNARRFQRAVGRGTQQSIHARALLFIQ